MSENVKALYDGFGSLDYGVNAQPNHSTESQVNPNGLARNQVAFAINCSFRGGIGATHRPPYVRPELVFPDSTVLAAFGPSGLFQGAGVHEAEESSILVSISGRQYQIRVEDDFTVRDLTLAGDPNPSNTDFAWFVQAGPFSVIQAELAAPLIFDGTTMRRSKGDEIKAGTCMAFSQGRIWYGVFDQYHRVTRFRATDLAGSKNTGTAQYNYQDSVLKETENTFLNEGGDFSGRSDMGEIRAMVVPRMLDKSLGQGPLQVFCERGVISCNAPVDRTTWKDVTYPIETESQLDYGALGACQAVNVNGDIIYRSREGYISFKSARADFQTWLNVPLSGEVDPIIEGDPEPLLLYGSAVNFDSRFLGTTMPRPTSGGIVHDGLVALDMNLVANMRKKDNPAWEGLWTGISVLRVFKGTFAKVERCFAFVRTAQGRIELWEILPSATSVIWDNEKVPIVWSFETPAYDFNSPQDVKRLMTGAVWTADVQETVEYLVQWRPDQHPCYRDWHAWSDCAPVRQCTLPRCGTPRNLKPQYRPKVRLPQPPDICNEVNRSNYRDGCEHQFRIQVTGHTLIRKFRPAAIDRPEPFFEGCPLVGPCLPLECCSPDPMEYSSAPYHSSGSSPPDYAGYPYIGYPPPPHEYPVPDDPPCLECGVVNPPTPVGEPTPTERTTTTEFPGLPPVVLLPDPEAAQLAGQVFEGEWTEPGTSNTFEIGSVSQPPDGLQDGTLTDWATELWQQFSAYVVANGLTITACQIQTAWVGDGIGPGFYKRWQADQVFQSDFYFAAYGYGYVLAIIYQQA